jgi:endonuclease III
LPPSRRRSPWRRAGGHVSAWRARRRAQLEASASPRWRVAPFRPPPPARVRAILRRLRAWHGPAPQTALGQVEDPFEVLIGTLLSHRTRDERTLPATRALFKRWSDAASLAKAEPREVRDLLREHKVGFYNMKAPRVVQVAGIVANDLGGKTPDTLEGLLALPGVGRKTANCVLVYGFGSAAIPVDTHVHRISNRLGLVRTRDPDATEAALMRVVPRGDWVMFNEWLVSYGKEVCKPIGPRCGDCTLATLCPSRRVEKKGAGPAPGRRALRDTPRPGRSPRARG